MASITQDFVMDPNWIHHFFLFENHPRDSAQSFQICLGGWGLGFRVIKKYRTLSVASVTQDFVMDPNWIHPFLCLKTIPEIVHNPFKYVWGVGV